MMRKLSSTDSDFATQLDLLLQIPEEDKAAVHKATADIITQVRAKGDAALVSYTKQFDDRKVQGMDDLRVAPAQLKQAHDKLPKEVREALTASFKRVKSYHEAQLAAHGDLKHWQYEDELGNALGQQIRPLSRLGIYVPGGTAAYPSTIIMTAVPARVAGVEELTLCVPMPGGAASDALLAAAHLAGIKQVFSIGGAQAIAAMAYGTESVPQVDKIVGPGNIYVATAKEMVFGQVGIDMIAGPSEVVIIADEQANPEWLVQDLFAQAEHDEQAQAILITPSEKIIAQVLERLPERLAASARRAVIEASLARRGAVIKVADIKEAIALANRIAPEHLQLAVADAESHLTEVQHAGAVFLGNETAEVVGDYTAGPSHVLPTSGTARYASPLGVYDFVSRTSVVRCSRRGAVELNRDAAILAREEGLDAHAQAAESRVAG
ncbi:MAG: histidinol dehydrogenase [Pseudomonadales bacterium]